MGFSVIYQIQSCINVGSVYTSSHTISDLNEDETISYSYTYTDSVPEKGLNLTFNRKTGNFAITASKLGTFKFTITVKNNKGCGYNIPINIDVIDESVNPNYLQYCYQTGYSFSSAFHLYPSYSPEPNMSNSYQYMLVGAPSGIIIDPFSGQLSGSPINFGQFLLTISIIDIATNTHICSSSLQFIIYNCNVITDIINIFPNNEMIWSKNTPFTVTCSYMGAPPSIAQSLAYKLSSPCFQKTSIVNYNSSDSVKITYLINMNNYPGRFPITLTDEISGFFITSSEDLYFTSTAACFNDDTTILIKVKTNKKEQDKDEEKDTNKKDSNEQEQYTNEEDTNEQEPILEFRCIKDLKVGDSVKTYKHGFKKITHIGSRTMINNPESESDAMYKQSIRLSKDKITHDLIILGRHSLLVDKLTKKQQKKTLEIHPIDKIDDKELLITMFNDDFDIIEEANKEFTYYHLVLEPEEEISKESNKESSKETNKESNKETNKKDQRYGIYVNGSTNPENPKEGVIAATTYKKDFLKQFL